MKTLSLKLDDDIFMETESIISGMKMARNRYINEAVDLYNRFHKRKMLRGRLVEESRATYNDSMDVLAEFERLIDED